MIVEDLGEITPDVIALREELGFPGMKVLQFAFGDDAWASHGREPVPAAQLRAELRRLHRHPRQRHDGRLVREPGHGGAGIGLALRRHRRQQDRPRPDPAGAPIGGGGSGDPAAGPAGAGLRGPHERARPAGGQLDLALHGGHDPARADRLAGRPDGRDRPLATRTTRNRYAADSPALTTGLEPTMSERSGHSQPMPDPRWRLDLGANVVAGGVRFRVWAPNAQRVEVGAGAPGRAQQRHALTRTMMAITSDWCRAHGPATATATRSTAASRSPTRLAVAAGRPARRLRDRRSGRLPLAR